MSWSEIKHAVNSSLGEGDFKPLNEQLGIKKVSLISVKSKIPPYTVDIPLIDVEKTIFIIDSDAWYNGGTPNRNVNLYITAVSPTMIYMSTNGHSTIASFSIQIIEFK